MREIILGTAGHVDHGKTSLIKALTGIDTDRLKEEKKRGITIELGFAHLDLPCGHRLGIVDVPGHEKFVKNMVAGAAGMDLVAFIVAADEGVMPQTREHFEICKLLGVKDGLIVLTKKDMVEEEWLELVEEDVREYFSESFLEDAPIIAVSSTTGEGLDLVRETLNAKVAALDFHEEFGPFRLAVDRVFSMKGFGAVVTGTSLSGRIKVGDEIMLYPGKKTARIRGIQVHGDSVDLVEAGHRTAINLQGIEKGDIFRGDVAATPGCLTPSSILDADFHYLDSNKKKLKNRTQVRVHIGAREIMGRIVLLESDTLMPGNDTSIQLVLKDRAVAWPGDRYVIRSYSPVATIGGGTLLNNSPKKRKRISPEERQKNKEIFDIYRNGSSEERLLLFIEESDTRGITRDQLATRIGVFGKRLEKILQLPLSSGKIKLVESESGRFIAASVYQYLTDIIIDYLKNYHRKHPLKPGLSKEELRSQLPRHIDHKLLSFCLGDLVKKKEIVQDQALVRHASHEIALQADDEEVKGKIMALYRQGGLKPPNSKDVFSRLADYPKKQTQEVLNLLLQERQLVRVTEALYFTSDSLAELQERVTDFIKKEGEIDAPRFKDLTGLTRKFTIPLLEYFDKIKLTIRIGDKRVLRKG